MTPQKRAETCSCETLQKISFNNNRLIERCVRLYILYISDQYSALPVHQLLQMHVVVFTRLVGGHRI